MPTSFLIFLIIVVIIITINSLDGPDQGGGTPHSW